MTMNIKIKLLNSKRYKDADSFDNAIDRWILRGWQFATVAQDIKKYGDDAVAILWRPQ